MKRALLVAAPVAAMAAAYAVVTWLAELLDVLTAEGPSS